MGILDGKKIVITGVLTDASLAFGVAQLALDEGADIVLTYWATEVAGWLADGRDDVLRGYRGGVR